MTVLVAGGTGALGVAVVRELEASGYGVELPEADLLDPAAARLAVDAVADLEAVVDLVGGYGPGPRLHETAPEEFDRLLRLNLMPAVNLARAAMPRLIERGGGAFVAVGARAAQRPFKGGAAYATAKGALLTFIQALDADYRADGIRCNAIVPTIFDTPANRAANPDADFDRWPKPHDLAKVVRFLVSDDSKPTSGALIPV